jgi:o-succinylbenzoate---CoA ligase
LRLLWHDREVPGEGPQLEEALRAMGLGRGHRVALVAGNTPFAVQMNHAARRIGCTLVPLSPADAGVWRRLLSVTPCEALVCTDAQAEAVRAQWSGPMLVATAEGDVQGSEGHVSAPQDDAPLPAYILYTSGTTGAPRPVPITAAMLESHAKAASERLGDGPESVWACGVALHRIAGIAMLERVRRNGSTLQLMERFEAQGLARLIREGTTHTSLVPVMLQRLLVEWGPHPPPRTLQCVLLGGDHAPEEMVQQAIRAGWPIHCTYGLTESCSQAATATPQEWLEHPGTSGRPLEGVQVRIKGGEIHLSGPTIAGEEEFATGDTGHLEDGRLYVTGRTGDRITTGGIKVDPALVEDVLRQHPNVADACVVGIPDPQWGQRVEAAVVTRGPVEDLREWCRPRLPEGHAPKSLRVVGSLLRTEDGKLVRAAVRRLLQATLPT